jgi:16S rRNA (guanine966-N2)-methyltransferase
VTRIIGGAAGGRRLRTPPGDRTRPTSDRVREALFSSWESRLGSLDGLAFLDLYAGSGAVGLEARSRGARPVVLVEQVGRTAGVIRDNVRTLGLDGCTVVHAAVSRHLAGTPQGFDVVFLDPPYSDPATQVRGDLAALADRGWLHPGADVVVERSTRDQGPFWPEVFEPGKVRSYGETALHPATWPG